MNLGETRNITNALLNKHSSGKSITEDQFNLFIKDANLRLFQLEVDELLRTYQQQEHPLLKHLELFTSLRPFKKRVQIDINNAEAQVPSDYKLFLGGTISLGNNSIPLEVVDEQTYYHYKTNVIVPDFENHVAAVIFGNTIRVIPTYITLGYLIYLRNPATPFYDYCLKTDSDDIIYMPSGSEINTNHELVLDGEVLEYGVEHLSSPSHPYQSKSVEFEWESSLHPKLVTLILSYKSVTLKETAVAEFANIQTQRQ